MKKVFLFSVILAFSPLPALHCEPDSMPVGETGKIAMRDSLHFRLEIKNDSIASLSESDWDDLRSFGMYYGISWRKWAFELTRDGLTNRGTSAADRGRIDETYGLLSRRLFRHSGDFMSFGLTTGAGILALGHNNGYEIQKTYHAMIFNERPIPVEYDDVEQKNSFIVQAKTQMAFHFPVLPLECSASFEKGFPGFYRIQTFAETGNIEGMFGLSMFAGYVHSGDYDRLGRSFANTLDSENGLSVGVRFDAGILETGISYDITTSRQGGFIAANFPADKSTVRASENGIISSIDFSVFLFNPSVRIKIDVPFIRMPPPFGFNPFIGVGSGTFQPASVTAEQTINFRYQEAYGGIDLSRRFASWLDAYALGAIGIRQEQKRTRLLEKSQILDRDSAPLYLAEAGLRFYLPMSLRSNIRWGLDTGGGIQYANTWDSLIRPYAQIRLIAMNGWKQLRPRE
jgi:hypothetical protein